MITPEINKEISFPKRAIDLHSKKLMLYSLKYSDSFVNMKDMSYLGIREVIDLYNSANKEKIEMTSAYLEYIIMKSSRSVSKSDDYKDLFFGSAKYLMTSTGLRVPKRIKPGYSPKEHDVIEKGRKYWIRILLEGDREVREVKVPDEGQVLEFDDNTGLPFITKEITLPHKNQYMFSFWKDPCENIWTGHADVQVFFETCLKEKCGSCIDINTWLGKDLIEDRISFRPIALPEIVKVRLKNTDIKIEMTTEEYEFYRLYGGQGTVL